MPPGVQRWAPGTPVDYKRGKRPQVVAPVDGVVVVRKLALHPLQVAEPGAVGELVEHADGEEGWERLTSAAAAMLSFAGHGHVSRAARTKPMAFYHMAAEGAKLP
jgi:hypothetical protein